MSDRKADIAAKNKKVARRLFLTTAGMGAFAYASAPLYDLFCRTTGFGGTPVVAQAGGADSVHPRCPQDFEQPGQGEQFDQANRCQVDTVLSQQDWQGVCHQARWQTLGTVERGQQGHGCQDGGM